MTTAQVVETSVTVNNNSPIQNYVHPDDHTQPTFEMTPGFKRFATRISLNRGSLYRGPVPYILLYIILARLKKIVRYPEDFRYIEWAEPNTYLRRTKLLSSTVDSDSQSLHVPNLIRGEEKYYPFCLK